MEGYFTITQGSLCSSVTLHVGSSYTGGKYGTCIQNLVWRIKKKQNAEIPYANVTL